MKLIYIAFTAVIVMFTLSGCADSEKISIKGNYTGGSEKHLNITRIDVDIPVFIDSVQISKSGDFKSKFSYSQPAFYRIGFDNSDFITLIAYPGDQIQLSFNGDKLQDDYSIEGSRESEDIRMLDIKLAATLVSLDSLVAVYESISADDTESELLAEIEASYSELIKAQRMHNIAFILDNLNSFASIKALFQRINDNAYVLYKQTDAQYLKLVSDTLNSYYPSSKQAISLAQNLENELAALNISRLTDLADGMEGMNMDLNLPDISGKRIKLSSLRGLNYVLLSFWSAQSEECIRTNLQMKEYYKRYHNQGLEIYQVNLDENEAVWSQAVRFDELPWISVREDDPANATSIIQYNVTKVPSNYLLDKNGEIIGKDLFDRTLQIKLSQIFD